MQTQDATLLQQPDSGTPQFGVSTSQKDVKRIKTLLESHRVISKTLKISRDAREAQHARMIIPIALHHSAENRDILSSILRGEDYEVVDIQTAEPKSKDANPLCSALAAALAGLPTQFWKRIGYSPHDVTADWKPAYSLYQPMLLLNASVLAHAPFNALLSHLSSPDTSTASRSAFWAQVARHMDASHVALNAPVPTHAPEPISNNPPDLNILRSPSNLHPLHGNFGPAPIPDPTRADFAAALWVTTQQTHVRQTWAPRHTMFSAGNVTEKARLQHLPSVLAAAAQPCTAVDLFAGIGYFAFSYVRAGVATVLCWDLNPWSCEGLRRGAALNSWTSATLDVSRVPPSAPAAAYEGLLGSTLPRFIVFNESNVEAGQRVRTLRGSVPPVRHVNCGMLPSACAAWRTAVEVLDPVAGGWLHVHETVRQDQRTARAEQIRAAVEDHARGIYAHGKCAVVLEHVEKVKSVGPRMLHIVADISILPC